MRFFQKKNKKTFKYSTYISHMLFLLLCIVVCTFIIFSLNNFCFWATETIFLFLVLRKGVHTFLILSFNTFLIKLHLIYYCCIAFSFSIDPDFWLRRLFGYKLGVYLLLYILRKWRRGRNWMSCVGPWMYVRVEKSCSE